MSAYPWPQLEPSLKSWGVSLNEDARARLERYLDLIAEINAKTNLTAEADPESLLLRHAADGLAGASFIKRLSGELAPRIADHGTGGGFIGVALKLAWPEAEVALVETLQRKYDALNRACLTVGLQGLRPMRARIERGRPPAQAYDVVVERAFAPIEEALALAEAWTRPGGLFVAWQSAPAGPALAGTAWRLIESWPYRLPRESKDRFLAAFRRERGE